MLKKYLSKFTIDILPSVFATVVGAYIVNYYIIPKAREDRAPATAAAVSAARPPEASQAKPADGKPAETSADITDTSEPAPAAPVKKAGADKPEASKAAEKAAESRRHAPGRDKPVARAEPSAPAPTPVLATVGTAPADDRRDANDLARAAIERLSRGEPKAAVEGPRVSEPARTASVQPQPAVPVQQPALQAQPMQQLPPPITLATPSVETTAPLAERTEQIRRPRPPGAIPVPLAVEASADDRGGRTNVVEDVLSGAKSMFDRVIPRSFER